jgi:hypothetical protein
MPLAALLCRLLAVVKASLPLLAVPTRPLSLVLLLLLLLVVVGPGAHVVLCWVPVMALRLLIAVLMCLEPSLMCPVVFVDMFGLGGTPELLLLLLVVVCM